METYTIANPPVGIYKGDLPLNYAYLNVLLDIHARFQQLGGKQVRCHKYSLNALGQRAEELRLTNGLDGLRQHVLLWIQNNTLRDRLNLLSQGQAIDCSKEAIEVAQKTFSKLHEKGYLTRKGDIFYLDVAKVKKERDIERMVDEIDFCAERSKTEFRRLIRENEEPVQVTKPRMYGAENPCGGEPIAPIFVVANMWDAYIEGEIDLMAASEKELARYLLLRFYSQAATSDRLPMKRVFLYNKVLAEGGLDAWNVSDLVHSPIDADILRYSFAKAQSTSQQAVQLKRDVLTGGRNFVHLIGNLKRFFLDAGVLEVLPRIALSEEYQHNLNDFRLNSALSELETDLRKISRDINRAKDAGTINSEKDNLFAKYVTGVVKASPFCPFIAQKTLDDVCDMFPVVVGEHQ